MTCLVTGGAGFIGSNLVHALAGHGERVRVLDDFSTGRRMNLADVSGHVEILEGDLRDERTVRQAMKEVTCVFHLGALPSVARSVEAPMPTHDVNITGTLTLLLAARDAGVDRFIFSSSSSVYGDTSELPKREETTPRPLSPYALSKLAGEHYARIFYDLYGLRTYALRYFNVFGPRQDPASQYAAVIPLFVNALRHGRPPTIYGDGEQTRDFTFIDNVVTANLACRSAPDEAAGRVFNVACGDRISVNELSGKIAEILGKNIRPEHMPPRKGDVRDSQADATKAREYLGWTPTVGFEEGLRRTVEWFTSAEGAS